VRICSVDIMEQKESDLIKSLKDFTAGTVAGVSGVIVGHPFDTIKVRLQANGKGRGSTSFVSLVKKEGFFALYKGMGPPIMTDAVVNSVLFGVYGTSVRLLLQGDDEKPTFSQIGIAGCFAGFGAALILGPVELVKSKLQVQEGRTLYSGPIACMKVIWNARGPIGFTRGLGTTMIRDVPAFSVYFLSYEGMKRKLHGNSEEPLPSRYLLLSGALAGAMAWTCSYPIDVIKTRMQIQPDTGPVKYSSIYDCAIQIYRENGLRGFTKGLFVTVTRSLPVNATIFFMYDYMIKTL